MKGLNQFVRFDIEGFLKDKALVVTGVKPWTDFDTKGVLGTAVETVIFEDETQYKAREGQKISNRFEKLTLKVSRPDVPVDLDAVVMPAGEVIASVYGDYRNQLSVKCTDLKVVGAPKGRAA